MGDDDILIPGRWRGIDLKRTNSRPLHAHPADAVYMSIPMRITKARTVECVLAGYKAMFGYST